MDDRPNNDIQMTKKSGLSLGEVIIILVILFLIGKALGIVQTYLKIDPFGYEIPSDSAFAAAIAAGFSYLTYEYHQMRNTMNTIQADITTIRERIARMETHISDM